MIDLFRPTQDYVALMAGLAEVFLPDKQGRVYIGEGKLVAALEHELRQELGTPTVPLATINCTAALEMALHLAGVKRGDRVLASPMTCTATSGAIVRAGARIIWGDIDPMTGLLDPSDVARKVRICRSADTVISPIKAIVAVDWAGRLCDYDALSQHGIPVIADAAHSYRATRPDGQFSHTGADYVCWSFGPIKHLSAPHGGALLVPAEQRDRARLYRWHGLDRESNKDFRCGDQNIQEAGIKAHLTDVDAAILLANLKVAREGVETCRANAKAYHDALSGLPGITLPRYDAGCSYWLFSLLTADRDGLSAYLQEHGIASSQVHARNDIHKAYAFNSGPLPGVDAFAGRQLNLPVGAHVTADDCQRVIRAVSRWAAHRAGGRSVSALLLNGVEFSFFCDPVEVTSLHRPDTGWVLVDAQGHEHRWYTKGLPATDYRPTETYETPTLVDVFDGWGYYEDGERYAIHHFECRQCGERVEPRYKADDCRQYIPGLRRCFIDGAGVSYDTFTQRLNECQEGA